MTEYSKQLSMEIEPVADSSHHKALDIILLKVKKGAYKFFNMYISLYTILSMYLRLSADKVPDLEDIPASVILVGILLIITVTMSFYSIKTKR